MAKKILVLVGDFVEDYEVSAYPAVAPEITRAGGKYVEIPMDQAVVDGNGNLVTAPAWPAHSAWLAKFLDVLGTKIQL